MSEFKSELTRFVQGGAHELAIKIAGREVSFTLTDPDGKVSTFQPMTEDRNPNTYAEMIELVTRKLHAAQSAALPPLPRDPEKQGAR